MIQPDALQVDPRLLDIRGKRYGRLVAVAYAGKKRWHCICDCGNIGVFLGKRLRSGHTRSCGCLHSESIAALKRTHGQSKTAEYSSYESARKRCSSDHGRDYARYKGRGIEFRFTCFEEFIDHIGPKPSPAHSLDRIDNDGHYEPGNVRWATSRTQLLNQGRSRRVTIDGITLSLTEWVETALVCPRTAWSRIYLGWCVRCAVRVPLRGHCIHR